MTTKIAIIKLHSLLCSSLYSRCFAAGLSHTKGPSWHLSPWKRLQHRSPGQVFVQKILQREHARAKRALSYSQGKQRKRKKTSAGYDNEYGPLATEPDLDEEELGAKMDVVLNKLAEESKNAKELERQTVGQHNNPLWRERRLDRVTASIFGQVVKRRDHTPCHNLVKSVLFKKDLNSEEVAFGRLNEKTAIERYAHDSGNIVEDCGIFVSQDYPFLGASPDGLVGEDGLVEVKCLPSVCDSLETSVQLKKNLCLELCNKKKLKLKRNHNYYFQIQGQLNISKRDWCDLIIFTKQEEMFIERIVVDRKLWDEVMVPKLCRFFKECVLPEIADSRIVRQLRVRDPDYILQARARVEENAQNQARRK